MNLTASRELLDRPWNATDLDAAAEFWLRLYETTATANKFGQEPEYCYSLEVQIWGFPRADGESLRRELETQAATADISHATVKLADPDTLILTALQEESDDAPPAGLGLPLLTGPLFDGLDVEIRYSVLGEGNLAGTLLVSGVLREGELLVENVCRQELSTLGNELLPDGSERLNRAANLVAGLNEYRKGGAITTKLANQYFLSAGVERFTNLSRKLLHPERLHRLSGLLLRAGIFAAIFGVFGYMIYRTIAHAEWLWLIPVILLGWFPAMLIFVFVLTETLYLLAYRSLRTGYAEQYKEPARYAILSPLEVATHLDDPIVRKYTADLTAAGFVLLGDLAEPPVAKAKAIYRNFLAPDGATYLTLIFILNHEDFLHSRPRKRLMWTECEAQTYFTEGGRVDSVTSSSFGYLKPPRTPNTLYRLSSETADPLEFFEEHIAEAKAFADERGLSPARHESFDQFIRRQEAIHEEEAEWYRKHPYSLLDHLRWYLQRPRREQRS